MRTLAIIADISGSFDRGITKYIPLDSPYPDEEFGAWMRYLDCKGTRLEERRVGLFLRNMRTLAIIADISGSFDRGITKYIPLDSPYPDEEFGAWMRYLDCKGTEIFKFP